MNDPAFISHRPYTKKGILAGLKRKPVTTSGRFYRLTLHFCGAWYFLCAVLILVFFFLSPDMSQLPVWMAAFVVTLGAGLLFWNAERIRAMRDYKTVVSMQTADELIYVIEFAEEVNITLGRQSSSFAYEQFGDLTEDADSFYLWLEKGLTYRIPKDSFVKGDAAEFADFIRPQLGELRGGSFGRSRLILSLIYLVLTMIYAHTMFPLFF